MLVIWGSQPYALPPFSGDQPVAFGGITVPTQGLWVLGATIVIVAALWVLLQRTAIGRALRACAENPAAATLMGISVPGMTLFSFSLAAAIGAIAGIVIAPVTSLEFDTGSLFSIYGFIAVAIGGIGSFPGAIAGGLLLGLASQLATAYISSLFSQRACRRSAAGRADLAAERAVQGRQGTAPGCAGGDACASWHHPAQHALAMAVGERWVWVSRSCCR